MDLGPYEGIPGVTAPFVRVSGGKSGYFLDVDVDVVPTADKAPPLPRTRIPPRAAPDTHAVFTRGIRHQQTTQEPFTYTALDTIHEDMGLAAPSKLKMKKQMMKKQKSAGEKMGLSRSSDEIAGSSAGGERPRGRLLSAPHVNPNRVVPRDPTAPKPPPFPAKLATFTKETVIPATKTFTRETLLPGVKTGAKKTRYNTLKGARITRYNTLKGARKTREKTKQLAEFAKPRMKDGLKSMSNTVKGGLKKIRDRRKEKKMKDLASFDYRDYDMSELGEEEPMEILDIEEEEDSIMEEEIQVINLEIPMFRARPGQLTRAFKSPYLEKVIRKGDAIPSPLVGRDDMSLARSRANSPPVSGLNSPTSALSSPADYHIDILSLNSAGMQDACTIDKLKLEIQRLQKTLSDKEDLVLASRRIAVDKERKLKTELSEVTEKYTEVCNEKRLMEEELTMLRDNTVTREDHAKLITQYTKTESLVFELQSKLVNCAATVPLEEYRMLQRELEESTDEVFLYKDLAEKKERELEAAMLSHSDRLQALKDEHAREVSEGQKQTNIEVAERDEKLRLLKQQITSALDEKSIARQEQLKELSRELEHTTQENRLLHKRIQELTFKIQNCDSCVKLKSQIKNLQDGKRLVDLSILKPIKQDAPTQTPPVPILPPRPPVTRHTNQTVHDYDELGTIDQKEESLVAREELVEMKVENVRVEDIKGEKTQDRFDNEGKEDDDFVDAEETLPGELPPAASSSFLPSSNEQARLDELRKPAKVEERPANPGPLERPTTAAINTAVEERPANPGPLEGPTTAAINTAVDNITVNIINDAGIINKQTTNKTTNKTTDKTTDKTTNKTTNKPPEEHGTSVFESIKKFFDEDKHADHYAPLSITTSKCSVCQGLRDSTGHGTHAGDEFSIYGTLTLAGSPSDSGSFCPVCDTRSEHDEAVKTDTHA